MADMEQMHADISKAKTNAHASADTSGFSVGMRTPTSDGEVSDAMKDTLGNQIMDAVNSRLRK